MPEIAAFVHHGSATITPNILEDVHKNLPLWKIEFTQYEEPLFPHLIDQLEFLANVVEDSAEGKAQNLPFVTVAAATFAVIYAHRKVDLIPDSIPGFGHTDDSAVVRCVLIEHEKSLAEYCDSQKWDWNKITNNP